MCLLLLLQSFLWTMTSCHIRHCLKLEDLCSKIWSYLYSRTSDKASLRTPPYTNYACLCSNTMHLCIKPLNKGHFHLSFVEVLTLA